MCSSVNIIARLNIFSPDTLDIILSGVLCLCVYNPVILYHIMLITNFYLKYFAKKCTFKSNKIFIQLELHQSLY